MWENETVVLLASLKSRILGKEKRIQFEKISRDKGIPLFIKKLFEKRVEGFMMTNSPVSIKASDYFDIRPEDLETLRTRLLDAFKSKAVFHDHT